MDRPLIPHAAPPYGLGVWHWAGLATGLLLAAAGVRLGYLSARGAAGGWLGRVLVAVRGSPTRLVVAGMAAAAVLHSSSAVEVAVLALMQAGSLAMDEGLFVILGANVGTTATAQLVALRLPGLGLFLMGAGLGGALVMRRRDLPPAVFGLGCFLQGLELIGASAGPWVATRLAELGRRGAGTMGEAFGWGWLLTAIVQSSTAVTSMLVTLVADGALDAVTAVAAVLGANVGTVTTGLVASLFLGRGARWLAVSDFLLNLLAAMAAMGAFPWFMAAVRLLAADGAQAVAHAHTLFNVATALVALPLVRPVARTLGHRTR